MGNIFFKAGLIVSLVLCAPAVSAAEADFNSSHEVINAETVIEAQKVTGTTENSAVQAQAESQTLPGDAALSKTEQYYRYGEKLFNAGDTANALKYFYAVTKAEPGSAKAWKKVAFCYYKLKKHNYALSAFKMVLKKDPKDKDALEFMDYYKTIIDKNVRAKEVRQPFDSVWRAAVFPGFGQIYNNQIGKGLVVGSAFIVSTGLMVYNVADEKVKYEKYLKANENQEIAFKQAQDSWTLALVYGIIAGAVYAGGIVDAWMNYNCDEAQTAGLIIRDEAVLLAIAYRW